MSIRRSVRIICVVLIPTVTGGCGFVFTHGPPVNHAQLEYIPCTESNLGPALDLAWAGLNAISIAAVASDPDYYEYEYDTDPNALMGIMAVEAGIWTFAAVTGFGKTKSCKTARQQLAARYTQLRNVGRPQAGGAVVRAVVVNPSVDTLTVGQQIQLVAMAMSSSGATIPNKEFTWSSSNDAIASVSSVGLVTANSPGSTTIAASTENVSGIAQIEISNRH